ncbi:MAG: hypothetical protein ACI9BW_004663 [Gammaproteobacteria bacterium]|jgi:hypothetical protein
MNRTLLLTLVLTHSTATFAGHGFMNSFDDIESLPDPGTTPDEIGYQVDSWQEQAQLAIASGPEERYVLALELCREKIAEIEAMVVEDNASAAKTAVDAYTRHLNTAAQELESHSEATQVSLNLEFANTLLEHQYVLSVNYLDLPREARVLMLEAIRVADGRYRKVSSLLDRKVKESLFFKEEKVRWSTEVAEQADIQGL